MASFEVVEKIGNDLKCKCTDSGLFLPCAKFSFWRDGKLVERNYKLPTLSRKVNFIILVSCLYSSDLDVTAFSSPLMISVCCSCFNVDILHGFYLLLACCIIWSAVRKREKRRRLHSHALPFVPRREKSWFWQTINSPTMTLPELHL